MISGAPSARPGSSTRSAPRSAATAARSRPSAPTTSPPSSIARDRRADRRSTRPWSRTSSSAARTGRARTTATSRGWPRCWPGLPVEVAGQTVNRLCGSGLQAVNSAAHAIGAGDGDVFIAGGVESMTRAPYVMLKAEGAWDRGRPDDGGHDARLAVRQPADAARPIRRSRSARPPSASPTQWTVSRERQDAFALESQRRAVAAIEAGRFDGQLVPGDRRRAARAPSTVVDRDEHPRPTPRPRRSPALKPAFKAGGTVTAGNSSGINDGAAALLLVEADRARELGLRPMARVVATAVAGVHPDVMGIGPVPAVRKVLARAGLEAADLDVIEINEAFASQSVACMDELGLDPARVNPNGGAIALGPPARRLGRAARDDGRPRAGADGRPLRPRDDVHRRGPGHRDDRGAHRGLIGRPDRPRDHRGAGRKPLPCVRSERHRAVPGTGRSDPRSVSRR